MKAWIPLVAMLALVSAQAFAAPGNVLFAVTVKKDGIVTESPRFLAEVGRPATLRLPDGLSIEGLTDPPEADGRAWTKVRITYFQGSDSKFVQEMSMHHAIAQGGSFEFTDPAQHRKVSISVSEAK